MTKYGKGDWAYPDFTSEVGKTIDLVGGTSKDSGILLIAFDVTFVPHLGQWFAGRSNKHSHPIGLATTRSAIVVG